MFKVEPQEKLIPAGGKITVVDKNAGETVERDYLELVITANAADGGASNIPVEWDFVKDERGTSGDEFTVRRTGTTNVL